MKLKEKAMTRMKTDNDYRLLKATSTSSLSGRSSIKAEYSYHEPSKTIMFRLVENTGSGHFSSAYIKLDDILKCLETAKEPFSLSVFKELFPKMSSANNVGFLASVLLNSEGLITIEKRKYIRKGNPKTFLAELSKLIKPTGTTPAKLRPAPEKSRKPSPEPQQPEEQP